MSPPRDPMEYFRDMLTETQFARQFVTGVTFESFAANPEKQRAVMRTLVVLGEAARSIPEPIRNGHSEIDWRKIRETYDRLTHDYATVSLESVWDTTVSDLPTLQEQIKEILKKDTL